MWNEKKMSMFLSYIDKFFKGKLFLPDCRSDMIIINTPVMISPGGGGGD